MLKCATMKIIGILLAIALSNSAIAGTDCLRFMGKVDKLLWSKRCNVVLSDQSLEPVESIDACFGKFVQRGVTYLVFNSEVQKVRGYVKRDSIITKASYRTHATENRDQIKAEISSASPELFTRYRHSIEFDKHSQILEIRKEKGFFQMEQQFDLTLQCD